MLICVSETLDPYYNLATEEYLFKNKTQDLLFIYRNNPCVVVGKHQNAIEEVNMSYVLKNSIAVVRRMSGGGTVYHDPGNINYSFHLSIEDSSKINYQILKQPVVDVLRQMGLEIEQNSRNDLLISGFKISGSASHVGKKRVINHGTLLFNTDLNHLSKALKKEGVEYLSKGVKSVRSHVANISSFMKYQQDEKAFLDAFFSSIKIYLGAERFILSEEENEAIEGLIVDKYRTWEWNFGYSPDYCIRKEVCWGNSNHFKIEVQVSKGIIQKVTKDNLSIDESNELPDFDLLIGEKHSYAQLLRIFKAEHDRLDAEWDPEQIVFDLL